MSGGVFVRPDVRALLDAIAAGPAVPAMSAVGPVQAREMMRGMGPLFDAPVGELAVVRDLEMPAPHGTIPLRLFDARAERAAGPVVVFFHGGGYVCGDLDTHAPACAELARLLDMPVVSVDYRLAPEHPWPAASDDCEAAARWVAESPVLLGYDVTGIIPIGDSAGGGLVITTGMALRDRPAAVPVLAQWAAYPVADLVSRRDSHRDFATGYVLEVSELQWFYDCYAVGGQHWHAAPVLADQRGMPPTLVSTSSLDPLRDEGRAYAAALVNAGVQTSFHEADGMIHGYFSFRKALPSGQQDVEECVTLLKALLATA